MLPLTEPEYAGLRPLPAPHLGQRRHLDRIAHGGRGAVRFEVADRRRGDAGQRLRRGDHRRLAVGAGRGEADLALAVVVDRGAQDDGVHVIAVGDRVGEPLEHHHTGAVAFDEPLGGGIEGPAVPVR